MRPSVFASRDFKENEKNCISSNRQGQTQGQGQIKVKGQGHLEIFTILYAIDVIWLIYDNVQPILPKIGTHIAWTYPMLFAKT